MCKTFVVALAASVFMTSVSLPVRAELCQSEGAVVTVTPCQETKAGTIALGSSGVCGSSMGSGPEKTRQFTLSTWLSWKDPTTGQYYRVNGVGITIDKTLDCGEETTYEQFVNYYSPAYADGAYSANGSIKVSDFDAPTGMKLLSTKSCEYTVDNP